MIRAMAMNFPTHFTAVANTMCIFAYQGRINLSEKNKIMSCFLKKL